MLIDGVQAQPRLAAQPAETTLSPQCIDGFVFARVGVAGGIGRAALRARPPAEAACPQRSNRVHGIVVEESVAVSCLLLNLTHDGGVVPSASNAIGANLLGTVIIVQHRYFSSTLPY